MGLFDEYFVEAPEAVLSIHSYEKLKDQLETITIGHVAFCCLVHCFRADYCMKWMLLLLRRSQSLIPKLRLSLLLVPKLCGYRTNTSIGIIAEGLSWKADIYGDKDGSCLCGITVDFPEWECSDDTRHTSTRGLLP